MRSLRPSLTIALFAGSFAVIGCAGDDDDDDSMNTAPVMPGVGQTGTGGGLDAGTPPAATAQADAGLTGIVNSFLGDGGLNGLTGLLGEGGLSGISSLLGDAGLSGLSGLLGEGGLSGIFNRDGGFTGGGGLTGGGGATGGIGQLCSFAPQFCAGGAAGAGAGGAAAGGTTAP